MFRGDFLNPSSLAVIGASSNPNKVGFVILKNIIDGGFGGKVYPINPDADSIIGLKCYPSVLSIKAKIELAVIAVPADVVGNVLIECGKKGIKKVVIISSGFSEIGEEGRKKEEGLTKIAALYGIRILGPNCLGFIDTIHKLNLSFALNLPQKKDIAVISQSGATCSAILDWANDNGIGFSHFVSLGNKADLDETEFFEYLEKDEKTKVVLAYLESVKNGTDFLETASRLTKKKPLIVLKSGRTADGKKAATSHTGALAGDDQVVSTAFEQAGIIRADNLQDLFEWGMLFSDLEVPKKDEVLVITNAGGPAVMATDAIANAKNLKLFTFNYTEADRIRKVIGKINICNPLDLWGDATSSRFGQVIEQLKTKDILKLVMLTPQSMTDAEKIAKTIISYNDHKTVVVLIGGGRFKEAKRLFAEARIPVFSYPERAVLAIDKLIGYVKYQARKAQKKTYIKGFYKAAEKVIDTKEVYEDQDLAKIFAAYHIPMAQSKITRSAEEAIKIAEKIGYPIVLKVTSPDILHKTEAGAIKLGVENATVLRSSYQEVLKNARKHFPEARILGVAVYKMVRSQVEIALGAKRDPIFGPVIMFGLGGIYIELLKDYQLRLAPVSVEDAMEMIKNIKGFGMLDGFRNGERFDIEMIAKAISGLSALMLDFPEINEVDINPVKVNVKGQGILALDGKIISEKVKVLVS